MVSFLPKGRAAAQSVRHEIPAIYVNREREFAASASVTECCHQPF